ncbi:MAG: hypothetical protein ACPGQS_11845 [Bradymonadia bacterium]
MLRYVQPPARRHKVASDWMKFNFRRCGYGAVTYVRNNGPRVLGTAWDAKLLILTWEMQAPTAIKVEAVKQKRRL